MPKESRNPTLFVLVLSSALILGCKGDTKDEKKEDKKDDKTEATQKVDQPADGPVKKDEKKDEKSELVQKFEKAADTACACKDTTCASKVMGDLFAGLKDKKEPPKADQPPLEAAMKKARGCMEKLAAAKKDENKDEETAARSELVLKFEKAADGVCACKDVACAQKAMGGIFAVIKDLKEPPKADQPPIEAAMKKARKCTQDLMKKKADKTEAIPKVDQPAAKDEKKDEGGTSEAVERFEKAAGVVCACKDTTCASKAMTDLFATLKGMKEPPKPDQVAIEASMKTIKGCMEKLAKAKAGDVKPTP